MIDENINKIHSEIPDYVELIAISKTKPNEDIMKAYKNGHRSFGENKIQEMSRKFEDQFKNTEKFKSQNSKKYKTRQKGKTIVEYEDDEKEKKKDYGGDYVDFEELEK